MPRHSHLHKPSRRFCTRCSRLTQRRLAELDQAGIRYTYRETLDVAHKWLARRRCLNEFMTLLFR